MKKSIMLSVVIMVANVLVMQARTATLEEIAVFNVLDRHGRSPVAAFCVEDVDYASCKVLLEHFTKALEYEKNRDLFNVTTNASVQNLAYYVHEDLTKKT